MFFVYKKLKLFETGIIVFQLVEVELSEIAKNLSFPICTVK